MSMCRAISAGKVRVSGAVPARRACTGKSTQAGPGTATRTRVSPLVLQACNQAKAQSQPQSNLMPAQRNYAGISIYTPRRLPRATATTSRQHHAGLNLCVAADGNRSRRQDLILYCSAPRQGSGREPLHPNPSQPSACICHPE